MFFIRSYVLRDDKQTEYIQTRAHEKYCKLMNNRFNNFLFSSEMEDLNNLLHQPLPTTEEELINELAWQHFLSELCTQILRWDAEASGHRMNE